MDQFLTSPGLTVARCNSRSTGRRVAFEPSCELPWRAPALEPCRAIPSRYGPFVAPASHDAGRVVDEMTTAIYAGLVALLLLMLARDIRRRPEGQSRIVTLKKPSLSS